MAEAAIEADVARLVARLEGLPPEEARPSWGGAAVWVVVAAALVVAGLALAAYLGWVESVLRIRD